MTQYEKYKVKLKNLRLADKKKKNSSPIETHHLKALIDISKQIVGYLKLEDVLGLVLENAVALTNADRGFIMLCDEKGFWSFKAGIDSHLSQLLPDQFKLSMNIINQLADKKEIIYISDVLKRQDFKDKKSIRELGLKMVLAAPLMMKEKVIGALYVDSINPASSFSEREKYLFEIFSGFACIAITNARLYLSSLTDPNTGLPNLQFFKINLKNETAKLRHEKDNISILMLQLDNPRKISSTYGRSAANRFLKEIGQMIRNITDVSDFSAYAGNGSFIVLLHQSKSENRSETIAKKLLGKVKVIAEQSEMEMIDPKASIGIAVFSGNNISTTEDILVYVENALNIARNRGGNLYTIVDYPDNTPLSEKIIGASAFYINLPNKLENLAHLKSPCLICGDTGVGKDLIARSIHKLSERKNAPFIAVNCAATPDTLFDNEFFGHEKGAFTGAVQQKKGKFELTQHNVLFLNEISEISLSLQAKLLYTIKNKKIYHLNKSKPIPIDVKIIAATNRNIEEMIRAGKFRQDLYYRLNAFTFIIPPLRERIEDIPPIAEYYLKVFSKSYSKPVTGFTNEAKKMLLSYPWYGNVRELMHAVENAVITCNGEKLYPAHLNLQPQKDSGTGIQELSQIVEIEEKREIGKAISVFNGNITRTAKALGISRQTLRTKIQKYDIRI
ncbi:sigma 54-interacting transcriptional regulator [bacterium]|nr:sigma 54-interacting transcriptional regulator [bacterium]